MADLIVPLFAQAQTGAIVIDGVTYRVPLIDSDGHVQVDVLTAALPTGAATAANQATMITALQLIDDLRGALAAVAADQLRTDVISSALPTGAATSAKQDTMITALQLIDNLIAALATVGTDQLRTDVISSALPTGAATAGNQAVMITALGALGDLRAALDSIRTDRLNVNAYRDGAGEVKSIFQRTATPSNTRATILTPASGKKIRVVHTQVTTSHATIYNYELYFGTGASAADSTTKVVTFAMLNTASIPWVVQSWPDGGGPLGAVDEVLSMRTGADVGNAGWFLVHYREE